MVLGAFFPPFLLHTHYVLVARDLISSLLAAPVVAILAAYMGILLGSYTRSKRREQDNARRRRALMSVGETLVQGASDRHTLLQRSAEQIRKGGHFGRLVVALLASGVDGSNGDKQSRTEIASRVEVGVVEAAAPDRSEKLLEQVVQAGEKLSTFETLNIGADGNDYRIARLYLPFFKDGQGYMILGAEGIRQMPFDKRQEEFLTIPGGKLRRGLVTLRLKQNTATRAPARTHMPYRRSPP